MSRANTFLAHLELDARTFWQANPRSLAHDTFIKRGGGTYIGSTDLSLQHRQICLINAPSDSVDD